jgi:hypothetical protein
MVMVQKIKFPSKATQEKVKKQIMDKIAIGKKKIQELEKAIRSGEASAKISMELKKAKAQLETLKAQYKEAEAKALDYVRQNPKKSLFAAAAVGLLAGAVLSAFRSKKTAGKPKKKKK